MCAKSLVARCCPSSKTIRPGGEPPRARRGSVANGDAAGARRARIALGLAAERRGDSEEAVALLDEALGGGEVPPAARPEAYAALVRAQAASGQGELADELAARTLGEAGDPRRASPPCGRSRARPQTADRQEALEFARRALALLDVTEEERELASLRAR